MVLLNFFKIISKKTKRVGLFELNGKIKVKTKYNIRTKIIKGSSMKLNLNSFYTLFHMH